MSAHYDEIGLNYANLRRPDPRIAQQIRKALGEARTLLNVGAGAGSYEPSSMNITALEPSIEMIRQRAPSNAMLIQGRAECLPFRENEFDAAMAILTLHHWEDQEKGVREMRRVARDKVIILTFDPASRGFWLTDYFPGLIALDEGQMPPLPDYAQWLEAVKFSPVLIPHDCADGFLAAYWRRPEVYLDARARAAMSSFRMLGNIDEGLARLEADLQSGEWARRYGELMTLDALDCGYRLVQTL